jgi:hypothetical protein
MLLTFTAATSEPKRVLDVDGVGWRDERAGTNSGSGSERALEPDATVDAERGFATTFAGISGACSRAEPFGLVDVLVTGAFFFFFFFFGFFFLSRSPTDAVDAFGARLRARLSCGSGSASFSLSESARFGGIWGADVDGAGAALELRATMAEDMVRRRERTGPVEGPGLRMSKSDLSSLPLAL